MSVDPSTAPYRPAYVRDPGGLYYKLGGGGVTDHGDLDGRDDADSHPIAAITNLQTTLDGKAPTSHTHTKAEAGLGNVDNTADTAKPVSTAQQTALNLKADTAYVDSRTPVIVKSTTAPTDLTAVWVDIN